MIKYKIVIHSGIARIYFQRAGGADQCFQDFCSDFYGSLK
jgi:hypothetical protein